MYIYQSDILRFVKFGQCCQHFSYRVQQIKTTDHPEYPLRSVILCRDSSIRIVSPTSGDVITSLIQPTHRTLVDAAYAVADCKYSYTELI